VKPPLKLGLGLLIAGAVIVGLIFAFREMSAEREREREREKPVAAPTRVQRTAQGGIVLTLDAETQKRIGLAVAPLSAAEHHATRRGFGHVLDAASLTALLNELALARTNLAVAEKELGRAKILFGQTNLSEKALLTAESAVGRDRLATQAAEDKLALAFGRELASRPDLPELSRSLAALEAALIRVDLPAGETLAKPPAKARVFTPANEDEIFDAEFVGPATRVEQEFQGQTFLYLARDSNRRLTPGANLSVILELPGEASPGVAIPRAAVVRSEGRGWAFVQTGNETFVRREVALIRPTSDGWFVASEFKPGEKVVVTGAQALLSEVGKAAIRMLE
jgi:hypothetical protein